MVIHAISRQEFSVDRYSGGKATHLILADRPNSYSTVQGVWLAYQLKYRFPDWLARHYR